MFVPFQEIELFFFIIEGSGQLVYTSIFEEASCTLKLDTDTVVNIDK